MRCRADRQTLAVTEVAQALGISKTVVDRILNSLRPTRFIEFEQTELQALTDSTITDVSALRRDLAEIRTRGYAASVGERQAGAGSVAALILNHTGYPVASMSLCGPVERFSGESDHAAELIMAAARRLSRQIGYQG